MDSLRIALAFLSDDAAQQIVNALAAGGFSMIPVHLVAGSNVPPGPESEHWDALIVSTDSDPAAAVQLIQAFRARSNQAPILAVGSLESMEFVNALLDSGAGRYIPCRLINQYIASALTTTLQEARTRQEISAVKTRLTSAVSHEFRNPLTVALSSTELLATYGENWPAADRLKQLAQIQTAVQRMNQIVSDVLDLQNLEDPAGIVETTTAGVVSICQRTIQDVRHWDTQIHPIVFTVHPADFEVKLAAELFHLVVLHLLLNAVRFSDPGRPVVVEIIAQKTGFNLVVTDQGLGIPVEEIPWVFGQFCRGRNVRKIPGIGLGLTIARLAANQLGGDIQLESAPGSGTRATATFPA